MATYAIKINKSAEREIEDLPAKMQARVMAAIDGLADNPRPVGVVAVQGQADHFRVRVGDYRVVYAVADAVLVVTVIRVRHRRDVYRGL